MVKMVKKKIYFVALIAMLRLSCRAELQYHRIAIKLKIIVVVVVALNSTAFDTLPQSQD